MTPARLRRAAPVASSLAVLLATAAAGASPEVAPDGVWEPPVPVAGGRWLRVLHLNDLHGHALPRPFAGEALPAAWRGRTLGGPLSAAAYVRAVRLRRLRRDPGTLRRHARGEGDGVLVLDAGDWFGGTLYDAETEGGAVARVLGDPALDLDAAVLGNHAWDYYATGLERFLEALPRDVVRLAANVRMHGRPLPTVEEAAVLDVDGVRVGVVGILEGHALDHALPSKTRGVEVSDPFEGLGTRLLEIGGRAEVVVLLAHVGFERDEEARRALEGVLREHPGARVDLVVDGHSHRDHALRLEDGTLVVQADHFGLKLGEVLLELGPDGRPTGRSFDRRFVLDAEALPPPRGMLRRLSEDLRRRAALEDAPVALAEPGFAAPALLRSDPELVSFAGDLVARAFLDEIRRRGLAADVGVMNQGGVRQGLYAPEGVITRSALHAVLPFGNTMAVMGVRGDQLRRLLERGVQHRSRMSFAGVELEVRERPGEGAPARELVSATLVAPGGARRSIDDGARYRIATSEYLASQGFRGEPGVTRRDLEETDAEAVAAWLTRRAREEGLLRAERLRRHLGRPVRVIRAP